MKLWMFGFPLALGQVLAGLLATVLAVLLLPCASAGPIAATAPGPWVVTAQAPFVKLDPALALLRDPGGQMQLAQIVALSEQAFTPVRTLSLGFTTDAVWLKFSVRAAPGAQGVWWLEFSQPLLEDVQLYGPGPDGKVQRLSDEAALSLSGLNLELPGLRRATFALALPEHQTQTFYLRVRSQTALSSGLTLWHPPALLRASVNETFFWGGVFGAYGLVILFYGAFWLWTRERVHGIYTAYVLCNFLAALFTGNWPAPLWPGSTPDFLNLLLGWWISLSLPIGSLFTLVFIMDGRPLGRPARVFILLQGAVALLAMALVASGHYLQVMPVLQSMSMVTIAVLMGWGLQQAWHGNRAARMYLVAFSFFYFGVAWRYVRNVGLVEPNFWNDHSYQIGAFVHMILMSIGIFASYNRLRRDKQMAESRADAESRLRLDQRDFMAMVSHELRTPLTIVSASADNLLDAPDLNEPARQRVEKIQRASDRMGQLMESYLANERLLLEQEQQAMNLSHCDLSRLCRQILEDMGDQGEGERLLLQAPPSLPVVCDRELVRIAVTNLVSNACGHSPPAGVVELRLERLGQEVAIRVRDQGPGVAQSEQAHMFKRFFRGQGALHRPGAGLGLYLTQTIARRHGGDVSVRNLPERGCEFCLRLPMQGLDRS